VLWLQAGITALVAVLFVALLVQTRQQASRIQELQERLQGLENSRALERTSGLEDQLRAAVERLQALESDSSRIDLLQAETDALSDQLRQLRPAPPPAGPVAPTTRGEGNAAAPGAAAPDGAIPAVPANPGQP
jgi:TolA-binding protein